MGLDSCHQVATLKKDKSASEHVLSPALVSEMHHPLRESSEVEDVALTSSLRPPFPFLVLEIDRCVRGVIWGSLVFS